MSDSAGIVGYQGEADAVVADVDVGVVVGFFGEGGGVIDEVDGLHEGGEGEGAGDLAVFEGPVGEGGEGGLEGFRGEWSAHEVLPLCLEYRWADLGGETGNGKGWFWRARSEEGFG